MRTEDTTLTAAQLAGGDALCKLVLTSGVTEKIYGVDTDNRILDLRHTEEEWSQTAQVVVDNRDGTLTTLALEGYKGVISYGYHTAGEDPEDEYSAAAPLTVIAQKADRMQGELVMSFSLAGLFNMFGEDKASEVYSPDDANGDTVKDILDAVVAGSGTGGLDCFDHCTEHTITYDASYDDSIIDTFKPADYFSVGLNESRLSVIRKLLRFTKCKARVENTGGTATIHIFNPADGIIHYISGSTYNYEYNDAVAGHNFFDKSVRKRLVIPNKVVVSNHPDHEDSYSGTATDTDSYDALGFWLPEYVYARPANNTIAGLIAAARLQNYQLARERGHGHAMMNVYQEVMDFVLITDSWAADSRKGNIGALTRTYRLTGSPRDFGFEFRFGDLALEGLAGTISPSTPIVTPGKRARQPSYNIVMMDEIERLGSIISELMALTNSILNYLSEMAWREVIPKLHVTDQLIIPVWIPAIPTSTTQAITVFTDTTATGNGTITSLGVPNPTQYGVCWDTSTSPTTTDSESGKWGKTEEGAATETGAFTTSMTGLSASTKYYVRAYATNTTGTGYGTEVDFTTTA